jgi:hypothetical protein
MGTAHQAFEARGTRSSVLRVDKCRHTITLRTTLFDALRKAALAERRSISEEMVARLAASIKADANG